MSAFLVWHSMCASVGRQESQACIVLACISQRVLRIPLSAAGLPFQLIEPVISSSPLSPINIDSTRPPVHAIIRVRLHPYRGNPVIPLKANPAPSKIFRYEV